MIKGELVHHVRFRRSGYETRNSIVPLNSYKKIKIMNHT